MAHAGGVPGAWTPRAFFLAACAFVALLAPLSLAAQPQALGDTAPARVESVAPPDCRPASASPPAAPAPNDLWALVSFAAIILVQAALISALVLQSRRRRLAEEQLRVRSAEMAHVARLSMVGALTASIAHEINQPMGAILSNAEAARMMQDQGTLDADTLREILADILREDMRATEVIRRLRKLLGNREWNAAPLDVNAEVAEALRHVAFEAARRGVRFAPTFDGAVRAIEGDSVQFQQVVVNLVVNAIEAVAAQPEGQREVRIETRAVADGAEIVVADHGPGIPPDAVAQLFESMFTTKKDGMGFGLSIVRAIVEMHRGRIAFEPNAPHGAIFRIWLPASGT